jgi:pilus assembly protein CpaC
VNGKTTGVTSLIAFTGNGSQFFDLVVQADLTLLRERLRQLLPRDEIDVVALRDTIVLTGQVSTTAARDIAGDIAAVFAAKAKVVNLLVPVDVKSPQVLIQVHVAEVEREALRELGINVRALGKTLQGASFPAAAIMPPLGALGPVGAALSGQATPDFAFDGSSFFLSSGARDYAGVVRALAERNLLRTLAKPNLVTQSGKEAKFLSGGEFPFPIAQRDGAITIQFREFGIGLVFTPVVVDGETIQLKVLPEVSSLDFSQGLVAAGFRIPVIRKNQAFTNVQLKDSESFAIAGLINNDVRQSVTKIPILGDIPILGTLFRSSRFQNNETELLFLVTVKLVKPEPPSSARTPDPRRLMEMRPSEEREFTLVPGIPGVGEVVERPFGSSNLERK